MFEIENIKNEIRILAEEFGKGAEHVMHSAPVVELEELAKRLYEQVEHTEPLKEFWEEMIGEIPDLLEWIKAAAEKGGEAITKAAETASEAAAIAAETVSEVAIEAGDVIAEVASEI